MSSIAVSLPARFTRAYTGAAMLIDRIQPLFALAIRLYVAWIFFASGLTKLRSWDITVALFQNEYHVPVLPPAVAAVLGTSAELGLPVLLAVGLASRFTAAALFAFNIVAVISYPELSDAGLKDHMLWGALLVVTFVYGPGKFALDAWIAQRYR